MPATLIDGAAIARQLLDELKVRLAALRLKGVRPGLAAVLIGDHPASEVYVRNKTLGCDYVGMHSELHRLPAGCHERDVVALINRLNADPAIHGILVQLPLPPGLNADRIVQLVAPAKD